MRNRLTTVKSIPDIYPKIYNIVYSEMADTK